jgi:hypothetical protein
MEKNKIYRKIKKENTLLLDNIASTPISNASILADTVRYNLLRHTDKYVILNEQRNLNS